MIKRTDIKAHASQPHTLSSRTNQSTNQSLPKSVSVPTHVQNDRQTTGRKEARLPNSGFAKKRVQCFYDSLVQGSSSVFQLKFCAENPPLRKAENRWQKY
jgi:hypothetical protein